MDSLLNIIPKKISKVMQNNYEKLKNITQTVAAPAAFVDMSAFEKNIDQVISILKQ